MNPTCERAVTLERLIDYYVAELPDADADALEEHLFACPACTLRLEQIARLEVGVRRLVRRGAVTMMLTEAVEAQLALDGVQTREFRIAPGGSTPCGAAASDDLLIVCLEADLSGVSHARLTLEDEAGRFSIAHEDIPLEPGGQTVRLAYSGDLIRTLPDAIVHLELVAGDDGPDPQVTRYTLVHAHAGPP